MYIYFLNYNLMKNVLTYPCWDNQKKAYVQEPIDSLSQEYIINQIRFHKNRIKESEYFISLLQQNGIS